VNKEIMMNNELNTLLPAPSLPQLNADGTLSLSAIRGGVRVKVPVYPGMKEGDHISIPWQGTPTNPVGGFPEIHVVTQPLEPKTYTISYSNVYNGWKTLKVWYRVKDLGDSETVEVAVVA
jgi:hypothetical protein